MKIQLSEHFTYKKLLRFVLPSIIMMIFTSIYGIVDGLFVSNYVGKTAFAAVNLVMPLMMGVLAYQFSAGLALYFVISNLTTVAQYAAMGKTDWSRIFPWIKTKPKPNKPAIVIPDLPDEEEVAPVVVEKVNKPSARASAKRVRPKMMTVVSTMAGLLPIMWVAGTGSEVMRRIAAPMVGGMVSSTLLTLVVIPALYALVKQWGMKRAI